MSDLATIERTVLAEVALADEWMSGRAIRWRLGLTYSEVTTALRDLIRSGDLNWNGLHDLDSGRYRLPLREVRVPRRIQVAS